MNLERVERAGHAVVGYQSVSEADTDDTLLGDLLADLMHWADCYGVDFQAKLLSATVNYEMEK